MVVYGCFPLWGGEYIHAPKGVCDVNTRRATIQDIPAITRIYNYAIEHTTATFDTEPKTEAYWHAILTQHGDMYPVIVAELDGGVAGWGLIKPLGDRGAYRYSVENALYVDYDYQGRGVGSAILRGLVELAGDRGYHAIIAQIVDGNAVSLKLHEKLGFERVGVLREVGWKFDRWLDLVVMERLL